MAASGPSFGAWVRRRRRALDLTQAQLAALVPCAVVTIRKIESDERRPSKEVAKLLAAALQVVGDETDAFLKAARAERSVVRMVESGSEPAAAPLPAALTPLIGRDDDVAWLVAELACCGGTARLVTLTGPPGVGKTRLAIAVAEQAASTEEDLRAAFVSLVDAERPDDLVTVLGRALLSRERDAPVTWERIVGW